jgi:hypothetical protein
MLLASHLLHAIIGSGRLTQTLFCHEGCLLSSDVLCGCGSTATAADCCSWGDTRSGVQACQSTTGNKAKLVTLHTLQLAHNGRETGAVYLSMDGACAPNSSRVHGWC